MSYHLDKMIAPIVVFYVLLGVACDRESSGGSSSETSGMVAGTAQAGEVPAGISAGGMSAGGMSAGETPAGEAPAGEIPAGEIPAGETPAGEIPAGEMPAGDPLAGEVTAGETSVHPLCDEYCDLMAQNCTQDHVQFESSEACIDFCSTLPNGAEGDTLGNSIQCRLHHGRKSADDPEFFCPHAASYAFSLCSDETSTPCQRLCTQVNEHCAEDNQVYASLDECEEACGEIQRRGNLGDLDGDTVYCRDRYALLAQRDPTLCLVTRRDGGGLCIDDDYTGQIDRIGKAAVNTLLITSEYKEIYNRTSPDDWAFFVPVITSQLNFFDGLDGELGNGFGSRIAEGQEGVRRLAEIFARDYLLIDTTYSACNLGYLVVDLEPYLRERVRCGGRTLAQNVIDLTLQLMIDITPIFSEQNLTRVTDNILNNDVSFIRDFPYLALPHAD